MVYNPGDDWKMPTPIPDDLQDVVTAWGVLPRWKARCLGLAEVETAIRRNDDAVLAKRTPIRDEEKAPPIAADQEPEEEPAKAQFPIEPEVLELIESAVDALEERLDALEKAQRARRRADHLFMATEEHFTAPAEEEDEPTLN